MPSKLRAPAPQYEGVLGYCLCQYRAQGRRLYLVAAAVVLLAVLGWFGVAGWISAFGSVVLGVIGLGAGVVGRESRRTATAAEWAAKHFRFTEDAVLTLNHVQLPGGEVTGGIVLSERDREVVLEMPLFGPPREMYGAIPLDRVS